MAAIPESEFDARLLDLHLGALGEPERTEIERRIADDPRLASQHEALTAMFAALNEARQTPAPPADLRGRILARVAQAGFAPRVVRAAAEDLEQQTAGIIRFNSFRDVIAIAAMIVLAVGVGVPGLLHMKQRSQRTYCSASLANIGRAMGSYASVFGESLPTVGWNAANSWRPTSRPGVQVLPNRRQVYPLVRTGCAAPQFFVCPSTADVAMAADQVPYHNDFLESRNVSYAYQNMAGMQPRISDVSPDMVVLGDDNPLFDNGRPLFDTAAHRLGLRDLAQTNSLAHRGAGQNILTIRGNVKWVTTPNAGAGGDNIWTLERINEYTGVEGPQETSDSHLLK